MRIFAFCNAYMQCQQCNDAGLLGENWVEDSGTGFPKKFLSVFNFEQEQLGLDFIVDIPQESMNFLNVIYSNSNI